MRKRGFTIIELIVVISIIMLLAGLITGGASVARRKALESKAKSDIAALELAIGMFETDTGQYPMDTSTGSYSGNTANWHLIKSLSDQIVSTALGYTNWHGPYMDFKTSDLTNEEFTDPWGDPYAYDSSSPPTLNNTNSYDIWVPAKEDDINNW